MTQKQRMSSQIFILLCMMPFFFGCQDNTKKKQPGISVPATKITTSFIPLSKEYIGITQSVAAVAIRARVKGFLQQMHFIEGKAVQKGQLLFVIDKRPFEAKLALAEGNLKKAIANEMFQKVEYERMATLVKKGDVSVSRFDKAAAEIKAAKGSVQIAVSEVEEAKINLGYCSMHAPFDGIISKRFVDVGNLVGGTEDTLLANVVQINPIYVEFSPSVNDFLSMLKYRKNMPFSTDVYLPYDNKKKLFGKIDLINNEANTETSTILLRALINNAERLLLPGVYVNLKLHLSDKFPAILVPTKAVIENQGRRSVYIVNHSGQVAVSSIEISGQYQRNFIVSSGIKEGDVVLVDALQKIRVGMDVTPVFSNKFKAQHD